VKGKRVKNVSFRGKKKREKKKGRSAASMSGAFVRLRRAKGKGEWSPTGEEKERGGERPRRWDWRAEDLFSLTEKRGRQLDVCFEGGGKKREKRKKKRPFCREKPVR